MFWILQISRFAFCWVNTALFNATLCKLFGNDLDFTISKLNSHKEDTWAFIFLALLHSFCKYLNHNGPFKFTQQFKSWKGPLYHEVLKGSGQYPVIPNTPLYKSTIFTIKYSDKISGTSLLLMKGGGGCSAFPWSFDDCSKWGGGEHPHQTSFASYAYGSLDKCMSTIA